MAYERIASTRGGLDFDLTRVAPNPPTMLPIIDPVHGTRQLAGYACACRHYLCQREKAFGPSTYLYYFCTRDVTYM
jgi:hypothetical protein